MRYRQLIENDSVTYIDLYNHLKVVCNPFFKASKGFKYVPHREMSLGHGTEEMTYLFRFKNRPLRTSVLDEDDQSAREYIDTILKNKGYASRHEYMVSSSSLGQNSQFPVNEHSPVIFPIGNFDFSYIYDDFNKYTDGLKKVETFNLLDTIFTTNELFNVGITKVFHSKHTLHSFYNYLRKNDEINDMDGHIDNVIHDIFHILDNVKNDSYVEAFNVEHEIWFNCKEYYLLPSMDYKFMMEDNNG